METDHLVLLVLGILLISFLYSSVGHAGASGYIAVMSLLGLSAATIKPLALTLNIMVATIGTVQFYRAGYFRWSVFWPFAALSIPCAFLGGYVNLSVFVFKFLVGLVLLASAIRFLRRPGEDPQPRFPPFPGAMGAGAALGLLAGLTGTGGGIFLTPLLILMRWAQTKTAAAVSAAFILVNSIAGLIGNVKATGTWPSFALVPVLAALVGGVLGSSLGSRRFPQATIKRLLAIVLTIAGLKLMVF